MAVLLTLLLGGPVWIWGLWRSGHRAARGNGAWLVWILLWVLLAGLVAQWAGRRRRQRAGELLSGREVLSSSGLFVGGLCFVTMVGVSAVAGDFGIRNVGALMFVPLLGLGLLVGRVFLARTRGAPVPPRDPGSATELLLALTPLLVPAAVLLALRGAAVSPELAGRIAGNGLAGLAFLHWETWAPLAALPVAQALDDAFDRRLPGGRLVAWAALAMLLVAALVPLDLEPRSSFVLGAAAPGQPATPSFDGFHRALGAVLLASSGLAVLWLGRVASGRGVSWRGLTLLLLLPPVWLSLCDLTDPAAQPLAGTVGCVAAWLAARADRRPLPG